MFRDRLRSTGRISVSYTHLGLVAGTVAQTLVMPLVNLAIVPIIYGFSREQVVGMLPILFAFNGVKAGLSSIITFLVYKRVSWLLKGLVAENEGNRITGKAQETSTEY